MGTKNIDISDEAYSSLNGLKRNDESFSETIIRMGSGTPSRTSRLRLVCVVLWGYCFVVWLYVIAYQLRYSWGVYDVLAWWLPIRMDYLAEIMFTLSLIFALIAATNPSTKHYKSE